MAIGRKNYLFAGSARGAERAAAFYTLIETAKLNGLDPEAYLRNVLTRLADHPANAWPNSCPGTGRRSPLVLRPPDQPGRSPSAYPAPSASR